MLADPLQNQEHGRCVTGIRDKMRTSRTNSISLACCQAHLFFRLARENADFSVYYVECVLHVAVVMPRYRLRRTYLQLGDAKAGPSGVAGATFNLIVPACVLERLHVDSIACGIARQRPLSLRSDVGRPDHLAPLLGFVGDELAEIGGRAAEHRAVERGKPGLELGIGECGVDL